MSLQDSVDFSKVAAVYFDLDDTLCAYWDASKAALKIAFERYAPAGMSVEEMTAHWAAAFRKFSPNLKNDPELYKEYLKSGEKTRTIQMQLTLEETGHPNPETAKLLSETYMIERDRNLKLFPESLEVLEFLKGSFPLGLITNGPADIQRQEINTLRIEHYFDNIFIEGEFGVGKPHESVFSTAAEVVGCTPEQILFVGNSYRHDIQPAIQYGWRSYWVRRASDVPPSASGPEEKPEGAPEPDITADSLRPLLNLLQPKR